MTDKRQSQITCEKKAERVFLFQFIDNDTMYMINEKVLSVTIRVMRKMVNKNLEVFVFKNF